MNYAAALAVVRRYSDEKLPVATNARPKSHVFDERSYSRWAADEILERIMEEELKLPYHISGLEQRVPIEIVKEYIDELYMAWESTTNKKRKYMYSTAMHTAEEILSLLYF